MYYICVQCFIDAGFYSPDSCQNNTRSPVVEYGAWYLIAGLRLIGEKTLTYNTTPTCSLADMFSEHY